MIILRKLYGKFASESFLAAVQCLGPEAQLGRAAQNLQGPVTLIKIAENLAVGGSLEAGREHSKKKFRL